MEDANGQPLIMNKAQYDESVQWLINDPLSPAVTVEDFVPYGDLTLFDGDGS